MVRLVSSKKYNEFLELQKKLNDSLNEQDRLWNTIQMQSDTIEALRREIKGLAEWTKIQKNIR